MSQSEEKNRLMHPKFPFEVLIFFVKSRRKTNNLMANLNSDPPPSTLTPDHYSAQSVFCSVRCPCIFYDPVYDTIRRRGGYRGIFREEGVDTGAYFRGNYVSGV